MTDFAIRRGRSRGHGHLGGHRGGRLRLMALIAAIAALAGLPVVYMLWPQSAPVAPDAPSLPIAVGGITFNVPPAAIRVAIQRRPGTQARIDMVFLWPSLAPPDLAAKGTPAAPPNPGERIFLTLAAGDGTLPPLERFKVIYPRYLAGPATVAADGLSLAKFRTGSPYQGEEMIHDPAAPERFLLRCTQKIGATPGMCLHERRIGGADLTARFPRDWLADWRTVADGIDRLIAGLRPSGM